MFLCIIRTPTVLHGHRCCSCMAKYKILCTPPPHISSSEEILPHLTRHTLAQPRTNKSPFRKSYLHKVNANHIHNHYAPSVTHTHNTHHLFNCSHIRNKLSPLDLWTYPAGVTALLARWTEKLAGGPQVGTSDSPHKQGQWEWVDNNSMWVVHVVQVSCLTQLTCLE